MKKSTLSALIFFLPLIVIGSLILVGFAASSNQHTDSRYSQESIDIQNQGVTISNGYYNISYSVNAIRPITIDKIRINPSNITVQNTNNKVSGITVYINNTAVNIANPLKYHLNSVNNLKVNVIIPCSEAYSNKTSITIFSPQGMFYQETALA
jgi:hypothetical protein